MSNRREAAITCPRSGLRGLSFTCLRRQRTSSSATSTLETTSFNTKTDMPLTLMKSCNVLSLTKERQLQLLTRRSLTNIAPNTPWVGPLHLDAPPPQTYGTVGDAGTIPWALWAVNSRWTDSDPHSVHSWLRLKAAPLTVRTRHARLRPHSLLERRRPIQVTLM